MIMRSVGGIKANYYRVKVGGGKKWNENNLKRLKCTFPNIKGAASLHIFKINEGRHKIMHHRMHAKSCVNLCLSRC